jgi:hypothetical protein
MNISVHKKNKAPVKTGASLFPITIVRYFTAAAAVSITFATSTGLEINTQWLPFSSVMVAPARLAMARCPSGTIVLSSVPTTYQDFLVFQAACFTTH